MCLICGNISNPGVTSTSLLTFLVAFSPLLGLFFYRLYRTFSFRQHLSHKNSLWRIGVLLAFYNSVIFGVCALFTLALLEYVNILPYMIPFTLTVLVIFWIWSSSRIYSLRLRTSLKDQCILSAMSSIPFIALFFIAGWLRDTQSPVSSIDVYAFHYSFGVVLSIQAAVAVWCVLFCTMMIRAHQRRSRAQRAQKPTNSKE